MMIGEAWVALLAIDFSVELMFVLKCELRVNIVGFSGDVEVLFYK